VCLAARFPGGLILGGGVGGGWEVFETRTDRAIVRWRAGVELAVRERALAQSGRGEPPSEHGAYRTGAQGSPLPSLPTLPSHPTPLPPSPDLLLPEAPRPLGRGVCRAASGLRRVCPQPLRGAPRLTPWLCYN